MENNFKKEIKQYDIDLEYIEGLHEGIKKVSKKYMIMVDMNKIIIYDFYKNQILNNSISLINSINYIDFHSNDENIFFVCSGKNVLFYQIINDDVNKISVIEEHFLDVVYGAFNPFKSNIFLSASLNGFLKIYDITNSSPISLIDLNESFVQRIHFKWGKYQIGFRKKNYLIYFEYNNFKNKNIKKYISNNISDFYFINNSDESLIIIKKNCFEIIKNNVKLCEYENNIFSSFYSYKRKILILINIKEIRGIQINDNYKIQTLFNFEQDLTYNISSPKFIPENFLKEDEICQIFVYKFSDLIFSYLIKNTSKIEHKNIIFDNNTINVRDIKKNICDIPLILSKDNNDNNYNSSYNPKDKNYFQIELIQKELIDVKKRSFLKRKQKVEQNLIEVKKEKDIKQKYISLLCLLVNDNTNTDLLKEYLNFIEKNNDELKNIFKEKFEEFQKELNYYSIAFDTKENIFNIKLIEKSQKEEFYDFLKIFYDFKKDNENDVKKFENELDGYDKYFQNISYFNLPIDFSNEQLFYYRNINLIKYMLKNAYDKIKKEIESRKKRINENDIEKQKEIENYKKVLIKYELDKISNNIKLCINDLKNTNDFKKINEFVISLNLAFDKEIFEVYYKYIMLKERNIHNLLQQIDNQNTRLILKQKEMVKIDINIIKKFYKNILPKKCFKSIYLDLYGDDSYYPFEDKEFTDSFIESNFEILDVPIISELGITDKFTMKTFFIPFLYKIEYGNKFSFFKNAEEILKNGLLIRAGNHEIGHNFTNFQFYMENCKISIQTPRKKIFDITDEGYYIDLALYGRVIEKINLEQALYIINEKNYDKTYLEFHYGFNDIKQEDLMVEGVFKDICKDIKNNYLIKNVNFHHKAESIYICFKSSSIKEKSIYCGIRNDILGRNISDEEFQEIKEKYGFN